MVLVVKTVVIVVVVMLVGIRGGFRVDGLDGGINLFSYDFVSSTEWQNLIEPLVGLLRCSLL